MANILTEEKYINDSNFFVEQIVDICKECNAIVFEALDQAGHLNIEADREELREIAKGDAEKATYSNLLNKTNSFMAKKVREILDWPSFGYGNEFAGETPRNFWLIDPVDSSSYFNLITKEFTTNVCLCLDGKPVFGIIVEPSGNVYYSFSGEGTNRFEDFDISKTQKLECELIEKDTIETTRAVLSPSKVASDDEDWLKKEGFKNIEPLEKGAAYKWISIFENQAHIYPRLHGACLYQIAASYLILVESKGIFKTLHNNSSELDCYQWKVPGFVVSRAI